MRFSKDIDNLVSKILSEEIKMKHEEKFGKKGQWMEIEMDEELHGKQHKIDVAPPKGKITAADFKKLRKEKMEQGKVIDDILDGKNTNKETQEGNAFTGALAKAKKLLVFFLISIGTLISDNIFCFSLVALISIIFSS